MAFLLALLMLVPDLVPNGFGHLGSLLQTVVPWLGLGVPAVLLLAAVRRAPVAAVAALVPTLVWCSLFGGTVLGDRTGGGGDLTVVSHNVHDANPDPTGTARALAASGAHVLALEELGPRTAPVYERALAGSYPYHAVEGTVGIWSKYPLREVRPVEIMPWTRALRATADTPQGELAVYVAHLASVRVSPGAGFLVERRNESAARLAEAVRAEPLPRVLLLGDFNGATGDSALAPLTDRFRSAQDEAGDGFGFTWPAAFPLVRIDQVLVRGVEPASAWTLPRTGSDHLPVAASLRL
ncbi:endonuclease/exonuclease/phosphatase family protein [Streptomyces sp. NPDC097619]|uniref:endonuclease/exonuclease/phosphatase family protein n=1 Tax=Streptomyces sp. NPDC097619 TaxID=3157228 RepID=UPI003330AD78